MRYDIRDNITNEQTPYCNHKYTVFPRSRALYYFHISPLRSRAHSIEPVTRGHSFEFSPFSPTFYHGLQLGLCNSPSQIGQPVVYNLTTICCTSPQSLQHLTTIFAAPHHNLCCTSPQSLQHLTSSPLHLTTNFTTITNSNLPYFIALWRKYGKLSTLLDNKRILQRWRQFYF